MDLKERIKESIELISKQNKSDSKKIFIMFLLSIMTGIATFFDIPTNITSVLFIFIMMFTIKFFCRVKQGTRLKKKLILLMNKEDKS